MRALTGLLCSVMLAIGLIGVSAPPSSATMSSTKSAAVMKWAKTRQGASYVYGGTGPWRFDCSGFTRWVYAHVGRSLPHSSAAQASRGVRVSRANARPGDLVFFYGGGGVYHAAIYAGDNRVIHASRPGKPVGFERIWTRSVFFKRLK